LEELRKTIKILVSTVCAESTKYYHQPASSSYIYIVLIQKMPGKKIMKVMIHINLKLWLRLYWWVLPVC